MELIISDSVVKKSFVSFLGIIGKMSSDNITTLTLSVRRTAEFSQTVFRVSVNRLGEFCFSS